MLPRSVWLARTSTGPSVPPTATTTVAITLRVCLAGDKSAAKALMSSAGVPVVPGYHGEDQSEGRLQVGS